jgi:hypothetical protein
VTIITAFSKRPAGRLLDIPGERVAVSGLPEPPAGATISRVDVIHPRRPEPGSGRRLEIR